MLTTVPYLHFMGNSLEALTFYKRVFTGEFIMLQRFRDLPGSEKMADEELDMYMHISLSLGNGNVLMATDALKSMGQSVTFGNNFHICINTESVAETEKIFSGLSHGGTVEMPLNDTMWGAYFGMVRDKFGVQWMINYIVTDTYK